MTLTTSKRNYNFIDTMRFIAMAGIVMEHSSPFLGLKFESFNDQVVQIFSLQFIKFGTIVFFILAGFLIGDKFDDYTTNQYLGKRLSTTLKPWLFWVSVLMMLYFIDLAVRYYKNYGTIGFEDPANFFYDKLHFIIVYTSFWFIINFMICITILLSFRKYMYNLKFGLILGILSLFYSANLYFEWIPTGHTTALVGFVFYLWLGVILHKYFFAFQLWIKQLSFFSLTFLVIITFLFSCLESLNLIRLGSEDSLNTLRITNIIFSLASFLFLYRFCNFNMIEKLNPRSMTFGIHLVHHILIIIFLPMLLRPLRIVYNDLSVWNLFFMQFLIFALIYTTTYAVVYYIGKSKRLKWTVGQ